MKTPYLSVAVPIYEMQAGEYFLNRLLGSLWNQTFQDFEIVITDNSENNILKNICDYYKTGISYYRNPIKGMAQNTNEAIRRSKGHLIKIIYMDDFLAHNSSLEEIVDNFKGQWLVTACEHTINGEDTFNTHYASYSQDIHTGNNTIGSPSVLTIKNEDPMMFDENLGWLLDCDYYRRMYDKYGEPVILDDVNVCIGVHESQVTRLLLDSDKLKEYHYLAQKYA